MNDNPVVCFCNSNRAWGGGERWHLEAALWLAGRAVPVVLAAGRGTPLYVAAQRALESGLVDAAYFSLMHSGFRSRSFLNPFKVRAFAGQLAAYGVRHLVMGLPADLKAGVAAARQLAKKAPGMRLWYRRGSALPVRNSWLNRYFYGMLDGLIVNSEETRRCVTAAGGVIAPERIHRIYNGLDTGAFDAALAAASENSCPSERPEACSDGRPVIGNAGRLNVQKGQKYLLHMAAELKRQGRPHRLIIAGSGELDRDLRALAAQLGLSMDEKLLGPADIGFPGFMDDLSAFWHAIDIFALSSLWEGFGYVLAEAMLAQRPLLAFNANSMPELVHDGENGMLLPLPGERESDAETGVRLACAVLDMESDRERLNRMGRAGRALCMRNFSQDAAMREFTRLLALNIPEGGV